MTATTHRIGALATTATVFYFQKVSSTDILTVVCYTIGAYAGSLFPDADIPYSKIGRRYLFILWPFYLIQYLVHLFAPRSIIDKNFRHRGIFHSPFLWSIILGMPLYWTDKLGWYLGYQILQGIIIGVLSHLILDFFSGGIPVFAPLFPKKINSGIFIKTGGILEQLVCVLLFIYFAFVCWHILQQNIILVSLLSYLQL